jgi:hypothetical protein
MFNDYHFDGRLKVNCPKCKAQYEIFGSIKKYIPNGVGVFLNIFSEVNMELVSGKIILEPRVYPVISNDIIALLKGHKLPQEYSKYLKFRFTSLTLFKKVKELDQDRNIPDAYKQAAAVILCEFDALPGEKKLCRKCFDREIAIQESIPKHGKRCPSCGKTVADENSFCPECGKPTKYVKYCHYCQTTVLTKFCPKCGEQILL